MSVQTHLISEQERAIIIAKLDLIAGTREIANFFSELPKRAMEMPNQNLPEEKKEGEDVMIPELKDSANRKERRAQKIKGKK